MGRVKEEIDFALEFAGRQSDKARGIQEVKQRLDALPSDLSKLGGADVLIFLMESHGLTAFENHAQFQKLHGTLTATEAALGQGGYHVVSSFMESPVYGSGSQYAQASLATGIRIADNFHYRLVLSSSSESLTRYFHQAGYRTAFVIPGTRLPWPEGEFFGFDKTYDRWAFDYGGPVVGWGELPDQYIIDFTGRRELGPGHPPTFIEYALITSHGPWATVPYFFENWDDIGNGSVYGRVRNKQFPGLSWSNLQQAPDAYIETIIYVYRTLTSYLLRYVSDNALIIALGDHQPVVGVSGRNRPWSVPVHVISRRPELLEPFQRRGYVPGLVPNQPLPHTPLWEFLPQFLQDFSIGKLPPAPPSAP
jgi:hypothetical protein